jgi:hypothetical protein
MTTLPSSFQNTTSLSIAMMSSSEPSSKLELPVKGGMNTQGDVEDGSGSEWGGISSENEINSDGESEHGESGSEDEIHSGNESEHGGTDSEDDFDSDGESEGVESSGANRGQPDTTKILSTFTLLPKLPIEIRLKIWKSSCFFTRNVHIRAGNISGVVCDETGEVAHYFHSYTSPPSLLHVCKESRSEALHHYQLDFGTACKHTIEALHPKLPFQHRQEFISIGRWIGSACSIRIHS